MKESNLLRLFRFLNKYKLNMPQLIILQEVEANEGVTTRDLAVLLDLSQQTLRVYHLPRLDSYLGKKKPLPNHDQRCRPMFLTTEGVQLLRKFRSAMEVEG